MAVTLKRYLLEMLREKDKRDRQRFLAQKEALTAAFQSAKEAVTKAENAAEKRFELLNELRGGVATKEQLEAVEKRMNDLKERMDRADGRSGGMKDGWGWVVGAAGIAFAVAQWWHFAR